MIMSTESLYPQHPFPQNWSAQDLADAVSRRLSDLITPELMHFGSGDEAANSVALSPWAFDWRRRDELSAFRVR
jgi:hypothetical protein